MTPSPGTTTTRARRYAPWLWLLLGLFCLRVAGQLLVALFGVTFLPPMEEWFSGVIPYPGLVGTQAVIIAVFAVVCTQFRREAGFFVRPRRGLGGGLLFFGVVYLGVMLIRYVMRMSLYPHERWTGGSIPIFFHWVLAAFLLTVGYFHRAAGAVPAGRHAGKRVAAIGLSAAVTAGVLAWVGYQLAPWWLARLLGAAPPAFAVRIERRATMTATDGVPLVADVYHPRRIERPPTILVRIPFSKTLTNRLLATIVGRFWAEHGYTAVIQGTRGRYESGGHYYPLRDERRDGIETLGWLAHQPWFHKPLGMWGGSTFGYTQWVLADQEAPLGPSALMVQIASTDFHGMFYPGGAFSLETALFWALRSRGSEDVEVTPEQLEKGLEGFPLIETDVRAAADVPFFDDWVSHAHRDDYWVAIDGDDRAGRSVAPALLMAGWFDPFLPTQLTDFQRLKRSPRANVAGGSRLIIGPWTHAAAVRFPDGVLPRNYRLESLAPSLGWFDEHLKGRAPAVPAAPVRIYVMGEHVWRDEQQWPLARTRYSPYYLRSDGHANSSDGDGRLALEPPRTAEPADSYDYDPRNPVRSAGGPMLGPRAGIQSQNEIERRADVLVYTTPPLESDLEVTGPVTLFLNVATTARTTDFTGKLVDVTPDDSAYNVSDGIIRRKYDPSRGPVEITIELWPTSMLFRKGHRLRLEVSSSNYPRVDRNPNTGGPIATETRTVIARQTIYHSARRSSRLVLPVIPR